MKQQIESMKLKNTTSGRIHDATPEEIAEYERAYSNSPDIVPLSMAGREVEPPMTPGLIDYLINAGHIQTVKIYGKKWTSIALLQAYSDGQKSRVSSRARAIEQVDGM